MNHFSISEGYDEESVANKFYKNQIHDQWFRGQDESKRWIYVVKRNKYNSAPLDAIWPLVNLLTKEGRIMFEKSTVTAVLVLVYLNSTRSVLP